MDTTKARRALLIGGVVLALGGGALGTASHPAPPPVTVDVAPDTISPFWLARILSEGSPDWVVVSIGEAKHPLVGAVPIASLGDDEAFVARAPRTRWIVLASGDPVRGERLARRLAQSGRRVRVLAGGLAAWDRAMDGDPPAPAPAASAGDWDAYRRTVALRRHFGEGALAPAPAVAAPVAPAAPAPGGGGGAKKREGC